MAWRGRLRDLILAGGAFAATSGCSGASLSSGKDAAPDFFVGGGGCGNADPDPCICGRPEASAAAAVDCAGEIACQAQGRVWYQVSYTLPDGAVVRPSCLPADGGIDGPRTVGSDAASGDGALDR
jgi:hypothetical protein